MCSSTCDRKSVARQAFKVRLPGTVGIAIAIIVLTGAMGNSALAQNYLTTTGVPTFSAPEPAEYGFVESANGNLHLEFPFGSFPERGSKEPYNLRLVYDSHIWQVGSSSSGATWVAVPHNYGDSSLLGEGWNFIDASSGQFFEADYGFQVCGADFSWTDAAGTTHYFSLPNIETSNSSYNQCPTTGNAFATDSSGFHLYYNFLVQITIYAPDGTLVFSDGHISDSQGNVIVFRDANGNYFSRISGVTGQVLDTLARTPANLNAVAGTFDVANSQSDNSRSHYAITKATISVNTSFAKSGVSEFVGTIPVVTSITLPDGTSFSLKYDCDSTLNSQACSSPHGQTAYYGTLTKMTLPTGGQVSYSYTTFSDSYGNKTRWLTTKQGADYWTYTPQVISTCGSSQVGCQEKLTVQKPSGAKTVYTFTLDNGAWLAQAQQYDAQGNLMATTANTWDFSNACVLHGCYGHNFIRKLSETTTLPTPGSSNLTKKTSYTYDSPQQGNVTAIKEWKFYPGTSPTFPSVPDRATYITYYSAATNIINKPKTITLCSNTGSDSDCTGGGSKVSQTKITYDSYGSGLTTVSGVANHDDANFGSGNQSRGNPTQIQQWVSGSTYLTTQNAFDTTGQILTTTDPAGNQTTYSYTDNFYTETGPSSMSPYSPSFATNAFPKTVNTGGLTTTFGYYFGSGKRALAIDPNNATVSYFNWDSFDRATQTSYPVGWELTNYTSATQADTYTAVADSSASSSCTSCRHNQLNLDSWGRKINEKLVNFPGGAVNVDTSYVFGRIQTVSHAYVNTSDPSHVFETTSYDGLDRQIGITHPDNQSSLVAYGSAVGNLGGITTQQSSTATYGYGYPIVSLDEAGKQRQKWVDGFGQVIEVDEPSTSVATDGTATVTVSGSEQSFTTDPCAPCEPMGCPACPQTTYDYGTVSVTVNGFVATANYQGSNGNVPNSASVAASLASALNVSASPVVAAVNGTSVKMTAKAPGTNFSFTTSYSYDTYDFHRPSFTPSPSSGSFTGGSGGIISSPSVTTYLYNAAGRLTQVVQGLQTRTFAYDGAGRLTSRTTPEAGTENFYFTKSDNVTVCAGSPKAVCRRTDARGITTTYTYNSRSQLTGKSYSNGQGSVTYQYDQGGAGAFAMGRRTSASDPSGSETYTYNAMGWVTQMQKMIGSTTFPIGYLYNSGGQVTQITYPSGRVVQENVDNVGLLNAIVSGSTNYASIPEPPAGYNAASQLLRFTYGNGVVATFGYSSSSRDQMISLSYVKGSTTLFSVNYGYMNSQANCGTATTTGNDGMIQCIQDLVDNGRSVVYGYDGLNRLSSSVTTGSSGFAKWGLSEAFDRYGNRTNQTVTSGSGPSNSLSFATTPGAGAYTNRPDGYSFDVSGNMLNDGLNNLTYDAENCLTGASAASYTCDAHGIRVKKVAGTTTVYVFSGSQGIAEYDNGAAVSSPSREYIYLGGRLIATIQGTSTVYHHSDHLSVRTTSDVNGTKIGEQGHYPYGEPWYSSNTTTKFIFTSYERDSESGNDYAMARYYVNRFGRFCSADPVMGSIADPQSWNRYAYARNNPVNFTDPSGMSFVQWLVRALLSFVTYGLSNFAMIGGPLPIGTPPIFDNGPISSTQAMLNSIYNPSDLSKFGINNWSPSAHDQMIQAALGPCGVGQDWIARIQKSSRDFDKSHQAPSQSYMHSMRDGTNPSQSAEDAINLRNQFIVDRMVAAQNAWGKGQTNNALSDFGEAIHPVMDSTSPAHTDNQGNPLPWCGLGGCSGSRSNVVGHVGAYVEDELLGGGSFGESAGYLSAHPERQQAANTLIRSAFEIMTGLHLDCD